MNDSRPPPQNPNWIREAIESYRGHIFEMSKDQKGCRYILSFFSRESVDFCNNVWMMVLR